MKSKDLELAAAMVANLRGLDLVSEGLLMNRTLMVTIDKCGPPIFLSTSRLRAIVVDTQHEIKADLKAIGVEVENA